MWQALLTSSTISISGVNLTASIIFSHILTNQDKNEEFKGLIIQDPGAHLMFCVYTPIDDTNTLQVFNVKDLHEQIGICVEKSKEAMAKVVEGSFLLRIRMPRCFSKSQEERLIDLCFDRNDQEDLYMVEYRKFNWQLCLINLMHNIKAIEEGK